jgi:hypothetical protein
MPVDPEAAARYEPKACELRGRVEGGSGRVVLRVTAYGDGDGEVV